MEEPRRDAARGVGGGRRDGDGEGASRDGASRDGAPGDGAPGAGGVFGGAADNHFLPDDPATGGAFDGMAADLPSPRDPRDDPDRRDVILGDAPVGGAAFGDTPISRPLKGFTFRDARPPEPAAAEPEGTVDVDPATRVRQAALAAAVKGGIQACLVGMFMGVLLGFFLAITGLLSGGTALMLGMLIFLGAPPVALLAAWSIYRQQTTAERERTGLCPTCGYDLRGIMTERCPECGTPLRSRTTDADEWRPDPPDPPAWTP